MVSGYVHGYSPAESTRLADQAATLTELLHADTFYPSGSRVLEALRRSPPWQGGA